jgi:beta-xylosidase
MLFRYNEKIASAKLMLEERRKACNEVQVEFLRAYDQNQKLQKLVYEFKNNDKAYLEVQNIAEDKVETFLTDNNTMKLLEFAFVAITEGLRKDPQREVF